MSFSEDQHPRAGDGKFNSGGGGGEHKADPARVARFAQKAGKGGDFETLHSPHTPIQSINGLVDTARNASNDPRLSRSERIDAAHAQLEAAHAVGNHPAHAANQQLYFNTPDPGNRRGIKEAHDNITVHENTERLLASGAVRPDKMPISKEAADAAIRTANQGLVNGADTANALHRVFSSAVDDVNHLDELHNIIAKHGQKKSLSDRLPPTYNMTTDLNGGYEVEDSNSAAERRVPNKPSRARLAYVVTARAAADKLEDLARRQRDVVAATSLDRPAQRAASKLLLKVANHSDTAADKMVDPALRKDYKKAEAAHEAAGGGYSDDNHPRHTHPYTAARDVAEGLIMDRIHRGQHSNVDDEQISGLSPSQAKKAVKLAEANEALAKKLRARADVVHRYSVKEQMAKQEGAKVLADRGAKLAAKSAAIKDTKPNRAARLQRKADGFTAKAAKITARAVKSLQHLGPLKTT